MRKYLSLYCSLPPFLSSILPNLTGIVTPRCMDFYSDYDGIPAIFWSFLTAQKSIVEFIDFLRQMTSSQDRDRHS
jgi:hypothetical protein